MDSFKCFLAIGFALGVPLSTAVLAGEALGPGAWGGEEVIVDVVGDGAEVEFECAHGRITKRIELDAHGDFDLPGTFAPESHGPTRDDATAAAARYRGHVDGDTMTLTVSRGDDRIGPYTLTRGERPVLKKCR
jgi:hypothetical protein